MNKIEFETDVREYRLIDKETKTTKLISIIALIITLLLGFISYSIDMKDQNIINKSMKTIKSDKKSTNIDLTDTKDNKTIETAFIVFNVFVILLLIGILALKKTIYYSSKLIKENDSLERVLKQWKKIDISLLGISFLLPISGFITTIMGIEFRRTTHFFVASFLLVFMLMPMSIKVRSRLKILKKYFIKIL